MGAIWREAGWLPVGGALEQGFPSWSSPAHFIIEKADCRAPGRKREKLLAAEGAEPEGPAQPGSRRAGRDEYLHRLEFMNSTPRRQGTLFGKLGAQGHSCCDWNGMCRAPFSAFGIVPEHAP